MKYIINPEYSQYEELIRSIPDLFDEGGTLLDGRRNTIKAFDTPGGRWVVKRYRRPNLFQRAVYTWLRLPKSRRAFLYAGKLASLGIGTPEGVASIEEYGHGLFSIGYFICLNCPDPSVFSALEGPGAEGPGAEGPGAEGPAAEGTGAEDTGAEDTGIEGPVAEDTGAEDTVTEGPVAEDTVTEGPGAAGFDEALARETALFAVSLHEKGVFHGDLNLTNIMYRRTPEGAASFSIIDTNRCKFYGKPLPSGRSLKDLRRITHKKGLYDFIIREYALGRGWDAEKTLALSHKSLARFERWERFKKWWKSL